MTSPGSTRRVQPTLQALETALVHLDETARVLRSYRDGVVFDPPRLEAIERRMDEIGRLKRKYGESVEAILALRARLETDLEKLAHAGEDEGPPGGARRAAADRAGDARLGSRRAARAGRGPARDLRADRARGAGPRDRRVPGAPRAGPGRPGRPRRRPRVVAARAEGRRSGRVPVLRQPGRGGPAARPHRLRRRALADDARAQGRARGDGCGARPDLRRGGRRYRGQDRRHRRQEAPPGGARRGRSCA